MGKLFLYNKHRFRQRRKRKGVFKVMGYVDEVLELVSKKNADQPEFLQAVTEVMESLRPVVEANEDLYRKNAILERITEPDRVLMFRVPWVDDNILSRTHSQAFLSAVVKVVLTSIQRVSQTEKLWHSARAL